MKIDFLINPPHPESSLGACVTPTKDASPLKILFDYPIRDVSICAGADGWFYLTGTTGFPEWDIVNEGIAVWKSDNLIDWISLGIVWSIEKDGSWQKEYRSIEGKKELCRAVWSPEIHFIRDTFWITYGMNWGGTGLIKSTTGLIEGPYEDMGQITEDGTDASMFEDEDGAIYWVYMDGRIAKMKDDLTGLEEKARIIEAQVWRKGSFRYDKGDTKIGSFGAYLTKKEGLYFMFCAEEFHRMNSKSVDTFVAVSRSIYGPYSRRYLVIPHGGQTTVFLNKNTQIMATFSGSGSYSVFEDRPAIVALEMIEEGFLRPDSSQIFEKGPIGKLQPLANIEIRDPQITLGSDDTYYLTGTSKYPNNSFWTSNDGIHLWSSKDLREWEYHGLVWDVKKEGTWQNAIREHFSIWAPEIHYIKNTYWITYSMQGESTGLLKSMTGKAVGPYIDMGRMTNRHIDSNLFTDEDGTVYYIWQDGKIAKMREDMSGFAEDPQQLLTVDGETVGYEGAFILKKEGKYILGAAEWNGDMRIDGTYDLMYAVSDNIYGPYTRRQVAVPHGGHGTMFIDREGNLMCTLFGNDRTAPFRRGLGIVRLEFVPEENGEGVAIKYGI